MKSAAQIHKPLKSLEDKFFLNNDPKEIRGDQKGIVEKQFQKFNKTSVKCNKILGKNSNKWEMSNYPTLLFCTQR